MDLLISAVIALVIFCVLWWLSARIPDAMLQNIVRIVLVVVAAIWLIRHIRPLIAAVM
jgi:hypothetical protein